MKADLEDYDNLLGYAGFTTLTKEMADIFVDKVEIDGEMILICMGGIVFESEFAFVDFLEVVVWNVDLLFGLTNYIISDLINVKVVLNKKY